MASSVRFDATSLGYSRSASELEATAMTWCGWVYLSVDRNTFTGIWGATNEASTWCLIQTWDDGQQLFFTSHTDNINSGTNMTVGAWYFAGGVFQPAATSSLYVAAEPTTTLPTASTGTITGPAVGDVFYIGSDGFGGEEFNGRVAQLKIWKAALTKAELEAEMYVDGLVRTADIWAYYSFRSGPQTTDDSGQGRTLTSLGTHTTEAGPPVVSGSTDQSLTLPIIASTSVLYAPTVTNSDTTITLPMIDSTTVLYAPTVDLAGSQTITLPMISSTSVLYAPTMVPGDVTVTLPMIASTSVLYAPNVSQLVLTGFYPTSISANDHYILDQHGDPWMMFMCSGWELTNQLPIEEAQQYLDDRAEKGFNCIFIQMTDDSFSVNNPNNFYDEHPFVGAPYASAMNDAYWDNVEAIIAYGAALGISFVACPCYVGISDSEGWGHIFNATPTESTDADMENFGEELGARFKDYPNIIWAAGGDNGMSEIFEARFTAMFAGLATAGDTHLRTYHNGPGGRADETGDANDQPWLDLSNVYEYPDDTAELRDSPEEMWVNTPTRPGFFVEGRYEWESPQANRRYLRRQVYTPIFAGCLGGFAWGNNPIWLFREEATPYTPPGTYQTWQLNLNSPSTADIVKAIAFLRALPNWHNLAPDITNTFLSVGSRGSDEDIAAAAFSTELGLVYIPSARSITIDRSEFSPSELRIRRFDPTSGEYTTIDASVPNTGTQTITHPGDNDAGDPDWVFVVDETPPPPGDMRSGTTVPTAIRVGTNVVTKLYAGRTLVWSIPMIDVIGTLSNTLGTVTASINGSYSGPVGNIVSIIFILGNTTASISGTYSGPANVGTIAATLGSTTASISGTYVGPPTLGVLNVILGSTTADLDGTFATGVELTLASTVTHWHGMSEPPLSGGYWEGSVIELPGASWRNNGGAMNTYEATVDHVGERKIWCYANEWIDGATIELVAGANMLIIEWRRGVSVWRATTLTTVGQTHTINLADSTSGTIINGPATALPWNNVLIEREDSATAPFTAKITTVGPIVIMPPDTLDVIAGDSELTAIYSGHYPDYEIRIDGGSWITKGSTATHTFTGLTNAVTYTIDVRTTSSLGVSTAISDTGTPESSALPEPVVAYGFSESGTSATDSSGNGNDGALLAGSTPTDLHSSGELLIDASTERLIYNPTVFPTNEATVSLKLRTTSVLPRGSLWALMNASDTSGWNVSMDSSSRLQVVIRGASGVFVFNDSVAVATNTTYHYAVTYDGTTTRVYRDGTQINSATSTSGNLNLNTSNNFYIGNNPDNTANGFAQIIVDDVRWFHVALTPTQVGALVDNPVDGGTVGTIVATLSPVTSSITGTVVSATTVTIAVTTGSVTSTITGAVAGTPSTGTINVTLGSTTSSISANVVGAFKAQLGTALSQTTSTTLVLTTTAAIAVGDLVIVRWAADNSSATTPTATVTDSGGNTYVERAFRGQNATGDAGVVGGILASRATNAVASSGTITLTFSGAISKTAKAMIATSFVGFDNLLRSTVVVNSGASTAASSGASGTVNAADLVIGCIGAETRTTPTADSDTTNGSWSTLVTVNSATGGTDGTRVQVNGQHKIATAAGAQTYDNTIGANTDWIATVAAFQAVIPVVATTGTITGTLGTTTASISGTVGGGGAAAQSVRFNTSTEKYSRSYAGLSNVDYTMACWVYIVNNRATYSMFLSLEDGGTLYSLLGTESNGTQLHWWSNVTADVGTAVNLSVGAWYYLAVVHREAGTDTLYHATAGSSTLTAVNSGGTSGGMTTTAGTFTIANDISTEWADARIAQVKVWTAALSQAELEAEKPVNSLVRTSNIWAYYSFKDGPQTNDESGQSRTLTASGTLTAEAGPPVT